MSFTINTVKLQDMVSRATKGVGNNKLIPLTSLMNIELKEDGTFQLITTDGTNYLYVREPKISGDSLYVTVPADVFAKLIARFTCENVTFTLEDNSLRVKGNGVYNIELPLDEDGNLIKYPDPVSKISKKLESTKVNLSTVNVILNSIKPSLAVTMEEPCYTAYYVGENVLATDTYKIASLSNVNIFDEPKLISAEYMDLLSVMSAEKIDVEYLDDIIIADSSDCVVYGRTVEGIEDFAIDAINGLVAEQSDSVCKIAKTVLLQVLDRISLFVGPYDKNAVNLTFTNEGIQIASKATSGVEIIPYMESSKFNSFYCVIDIQMLVQEIKAVKSDVITLYYGMDNAIKVVDDNVTIVIALLEDEEI